MPDFQRPRWKLGGVARRADEEEHYSPSQKYGFQNDTSDMDFFSANLDDYLEPAIHGPPSPEHLRQLSSQMKRASHLQRRAPAIQAPRVGSSASSSPTTVAPDYHPWEQPNDYYYLNRRPSQRSTGSSTPSRERPDSIFGKNIFQRKGRLARDSSTHSSSGASSSSGDPATEGSSGLKDALMPMFTRRKASRDHDEAVQRKLQISTPFNFQHVAHTDKSKAEDRDGSPSINSLHEFRGLRTPSPASAPRGTNAVQIPGPFFNATSNPESRIQAHDTLQTSQDSQRPTLVPRHTAPTFGVRKFLKQARSQDHIRTNPRRPATATPTDERDATPPLPPIPLRVSSRQSMHPDELSAPPALAVDPLGSTPLERPLTSAGFCKPRPFSPLGQEGLSLMRSLTPDEGRDEEVPAPALVPNEPTPVAPLSIDSRPSAASPSTPGFDKALPDVPEEEEYHHASQKARASVVSNSSLRGSHSVPMLRPLLRPASSASDTLGPRDAITGLRLTMNKNAEQIAGRDEVVSFRESWEDDIDYVYEHEVEANCDYQWGRSSIDASRQTMRPTNESHLTEPAIAAATSGGSAATGAAGYSGQVSALSPTSAPKNAAREIITSVYAQHPQQPVLVNNFSYNRLSVKTPARSNSNASSFKESPGFSISDSLLAPIDYREYMASLSDDPETPGRESPQHPYQLQRYPSHDMAHEKSIDRPLTSFEQRSSTSTTTESIADYRSDSTGERHASANSACTCLTGPTASSTSLHKLAEFDFEDHTKLQQEEAQEQPQQTTPNATTANLVGAVEGTNPMESCGTYDDMPSPDADAVPELTPFSHIPPRGKSLHKTHASESMVAARPDLPHMKSFEAKSRRARSRTTSLSQAPPVGQYALFPRSQVRATGDRI